MKRRRIVILAAVLLVPSFLQPTVVDQTLALARQQAASAESFLLAYYDNIILPRKTPTQTAEARRLKLSAAARAEAALRRFDALRSEMISLSAADMVIAGRCRLITLDPDRPSLQTAEQQKTILEAARYEFSQAWQADTRNPAAYAGMIEVHRLRLDRKAGEAVIGSAPPEVKQSQVFALAAGRFYLELEAAAAGLAFLKKNSPGKPGEAEPELYLAVAYYMNGDAARAKTLARSALGKRPECEAASLLIEHLEGMESLARGGSPGPRGSRNLVDAGVAFEQRSDHGISIFIYEKAAAAMPRDGRALYYLGEALAFRSKLLGRKDEARRAADYLEQAMKQGGMPDVTREAALVPLAMAYQTAGQYDKAVQVYREIIAADPGFYRYYFDLGDCLKAQGKEREAQEAYAKGKALAPKQTYLSGARWAAMEVKIGEVGDCSLAAELPLGQAVISGRVIFLGKPAAGVQVQLLLNQCSKTTTLAETDDRGEVRISLPPGDYIYNGLRVSHFPGPDEPKVSDLVYVPGKLDQLYETMAAVRPGVVIPDKTPGWFQAAAGENLGLAFVASFVKPLNITAPPPQARLPLAKAGATEVTWKKVPAADHYLVDLYQINPGGAAESVVPIKEQAVVRETGVIIADLFLSAGQPPAAGDYAVVVAAVDGAGQIIALSAGLRKFSLE